MSTAGFFRRCFLTIAFITIVALVVGKTYPVFETIAAGGIIVSIVTFILAGVTTIWEN